LYINIHSHLPKENTEWVLQSIYSGFERWVLPPFFSAGLHPWFLKPDFEQDMDQLQQLCGHPGLLAIGECGLDKLSNTDFDLQEIAFRKQIELANNSRKALIIHCVRAYDEVHAMLKAANNTMPVVFHGFNKSRELALQLIQWGYYLSFGTAVEKENITQYIHHLPIDRICFETDDASIAVKTIYEIVAPVLDISLEDLCLQIQKNVEQILAIKL
jgi:TatD DNase family protein